MLRQQLKILLKIVLLSIILIFLPEEQVIASNIFCTGSYTLADIQKCIWAANPGDIIVLQAGATYTAYSNQTLITEKPLTITTDGLYGSTGLCGKVDEKIKNISINHQCARIVTAWNYRSKSIWSMIRVQNSTGFVIDHIVVDGNQDDRMASQPDNTENMQLLVYDHCINCKFQYSAVLNQAVPKNRNMGLGQTPYFMTYWTDDPGLSVTNNLFAKAGKAVYYNLYPYWSSPYATSYNSTSNCFEISMYSLDMTNINISNNVTFDCTDGHLVFGGSGKHIMTGVVTGNMMFQKDTMEINHPFLFYYNGDSTKNVADWVSFGTPYTSTDPNKILWVFNNSIDCDYGLSGVRRCPSGLAVNVDRNNYIMGGKFQNNLIKNVQVGIQISGNVGLLDAPWNAPTVVEGNYSTITNGSKNGFIGQNRNPGANAPWGDLYGYGSVSNNGAPAPNFDYYNLDGCFARAPWVPAGTPPNNNVSFSCPLGMYFPIP